MACEKLQGCGFTKKNNYQSGGNVLKIIQNKQRRAAVLGDEVMLYRNAAINSVKPLWKPCWPFSWSANPKEAAEVWVSDAVSMFDVRRK